jgi:hypothetical protein
MGKAGQALQGLVSYFACLLFALLLIVPHCRRTEFTEMGKKFQAVYIHCPRQAAIVPIPLYLPFIPLIFPRMVNYSDPAVVAQVDCAYAFAAKLWFSGSQLTLSFDRGSG